MTNVCNELLFIFFRGVYGHFFGSLPWWIIEDFVLSESAKIVGKS